jgi:hypothetical protein
MNIVPDTLFGIFFQTTVFTASVISDADSFADSIPIKATVAIVL